MVRYVTKPFIYVGSGDYRIVTGDKKINLNALLGTCTGVALYDREAGVGGLCHILLPDTPGHDYSWAPKVYATPCLNLMLRDLLKAGAAKHRLEAAVAGGCLPTPCSRQDINLDIGGRTRECVNQFLTGHNIPIVNAKTGGCNGMTLTLNTSDWQTVINPISRSRLKIKNIAAPPSPTRLREEIAHLKPVPQIALKALRLLYKDDYQIKEITRELSLDQVLSAKVISFCNSAYMGKSINIDSIEHAAVYLGKINLLEILLSTSLKDFYRQKEGGYSLIRGGLFKHAIIVASLAEVISLYNEKLNKETAYAAGLLHDIGKVVLDQYVAENISLFYDKDNYLAGNLINKERELFGTDHQEMGHELADVWGLPESLEEAISFHHQPGNARRHSELVHAVYLADLLASGFMAGINIETPDDSSLDESMNVLGLQLIDIEKIIHQVPWNNLPFL